MVGEIQSLRQQSIITYAYDDANRLTRVGDTTYTWDERGNLTHDGTFTYTFNAAGRMVRAENVTTTLVYTYSADGLRVAQAVDGDETTYVWDWASGLPEMLSDGERLYLVGHDTLGHWGGGEWTYYLPDALGSVRQVVDGAGSLASSREWTPFGVEVGNAQPGLGYTGEWSDPNIELAYLRARWYSPRDGIFLSRDAVERNHPYQYVEANPVNAIDPSGKIAVRPPIPRPPDVCPAPTPSSVPPASLMFKRSDYILRDRNGGHVYYPSWTTDSAWWYCGEFCTTAYLFVDETDAYYQEGEANKVVQVTVRGTDEVFSADADFMKDVVMNGTGKPMFLSTENRAICLPKRGPFWSIHLNLDNRK